MLPALFVTGLSTSAFQNLAKRAKHFFSIHPRFRVGLINATLVLATIVAYLPALWAGFIWDDDILLTANPNLRSLHGLLRIWRGQDCCDYTPVTLTTFWLEEKLWGAAPAGYHVVNVLLHAIAALLLWRILQKLKIPGSWLAALLFAIHPVNVSSVAWIAELKNTISAVFFFASIFAFLTFYQRNRRSSYLLSVFAFALAGLSKGSVVTLPIVLCGCVLWMNKKFTRVDFLRVIPFFLIAAAGSLLTIQFQSGGVDFHFLPAALSVRSVRAGTAIWLYLLGIIFPVGLSPMSGQWLPDLRSPVVYLSAIIALAALIIFFCNRRSWGRSPLFVFGYYFVMLSPALGFFWMTLQQQTLCADWWQYLAAPGIFAGIAALVTKTLHRATGKARLALHALVCIVLMMLAAQTWRRSETYQSLETYCRAVLAETPHLWTLQTNLGIALERQGRLEEAIGHHRAALRDNPQFVEAHNNLANCLRETGDLKAAEDEYLDALRLNHSNPEILANLADVYFQDGKINDALSADAQAIKADRLNFQRYFDFGLKLVANNQFEQGIICFRNALVLAPDDVATQLALARALISVDQKAEAAAACDQALRNARKIGDEQLIQSVTLAAQSIQRR